MNWTEKRRWKRALRGCNYPYAAQNIMRCFDGRLIPEDLANLLNEFVEKPCFENAVAILKLDPDLIAFFSNPASIFRDIQGDISNMTR